MTMTVTSWGRFAKVVANVFKFNSKKQLRQIINDQDHLIARGNGRSYGDSALSNTIVSVTGRDYFIGFDPQSGVLEVQAGVLLSDIITAFVPQGWFLKVTPGTKFVTVGGAIASDVHGKNHHVAGCFSQCVESLTLMTAQGRLVSCSSTVEPEFFKATCGGMGLTGVIVSAKIELQRINSRFINQTTIKTKNLAETFAAFEQHQASPYSVAWIDCLGKGDDIGKCLLMLGDLCDDGDLAYKPQSQLLLPVSIPSFCLNTLSVRAFNWLYYRKVKSTVSQQKLDIDSFFYPLDAIGHWNRIYGRKGFTQYQFILPKQHSYQGLGEILQQIAEAGKGAFLAVLKLYGKANDNYLSFPMEGYSLALDFKIQPGLFELLDKLDETVVNYGGRIYLGKDVRVSKTVFEQGYPHIETFRQFRRQQHLDSQFQSLQSTRVKI